MLLEMNFVAMASWTINMNDVLKFIVTLSNEQVKLFCDYCMFTV